MTINVTVVNTGSGANQEAHVKVFNEGTDGKVVHSELIAKLKANESVNTVIYPGRMIFIEEVKIEKV